MANSTDPFAQTIHGTNPQYLIEKITRLKIYNATYWKEECFGLTAATVLDKAAELKYIGGLYGGNLLPTKFLCLVLKLLQLQPETDIILAYIENEDFKYVRALGAFYFRLTNRAEEVYRTLEPLYNDFRKLAYRGMDGWKLVHMDEFVDLLLRDELVCDIALPHIAKREKLEGLGQLSPRTSLLEDELLEMEQMEAQVMGDNEGSDESSDERGDQHIPVPQVVAVSADRGAAAVSFDDDEDEAEITEPPFSAPKADVAPAPQAPLAPARLLAQTKEVAQALGGREKDERTSRPASAEKGHGRDDRRDRDRDEDRRDRGRDYARGRVSSRDRVRARDRSRSRDRRDSRRDDSRNRRRRRSPSTSTSRSRSRSPSRSSESGDRRGRKRRYRSASRSRSEDSRRGSRRRHSDDSRPRKASRDRDHDRDRDRRDRDRDRDRRDRDHDRDRDRGRDHQRDSDAANDRKRDGDEDVPASSAQATKPKFSDKAFDRIFGKKSGAAAGSGGGAAATTGAKGAGKVVTTTTGQKVVITAAEGTVEYWNQIREALGMSKLK